MQCDELTHIRGDDTIYKKNWEGGVALSTEAEKRAVKAYQQKRDSIMLRPDKDEGARIRAAAAAADQSVQGYVLQAVRARMEKENRL